ncbi:hypothetical protein HW115_19435 [Verrucomicrobiaceae bacterium N1E253]|uniref:Uncharacterized protein n=1 Tax=Oceaniferula marina TaxID=2748318 RepID=A0A851GPG9_9BACT|nr:hypothetical protein [Oceaniferula marina]NWK57801.1 hypothetical protein [Oceaniferula marina]
MKRLLSILACVILYVSQHCCADEIKGYPVYRFINLDEISLNAIKGLEKMKAEGVMKDIPRDQFDRMISGQKRMIKAGFTNHKKLTIITASDKRIGVYVPIKDYKKLWERNPRDLRKEGKSHYLIVRYKTVTVDGHDYLKAEHINFSLVDHEPYIKK